MTELIVALDLPSFEENFDLAQELGTVTPWFKLGRSALLADGGLDLVRDLVDAGLKVMLDLKLYDPCETIARDARLAFHDLGAHLLTVYASREMLRAAAQQRVATHQAVLAIGPTTDSEWGGAASTHPLAVAQGLVLSVPALADLHADGYAPLLNRERLFVTPGVRCTNHATNGHLHVGTPAAARAAGATHVVVGRPIYTAVDPVAAARDIMEELV